MMFDFVVVYKVWDGKMKTGDLYEYYTLSQRQIFYLTLHGIRPS